MTMTLILEKNYNRPGWKLILKTAANGDLVELVEGPLNQILGHLRKNIGDTLDGAIN